MIRLLIIDDHWIVNEALKYKFRPDRDDITVTYSASTLEQAFKAGQEAFDMIILDLLIPGTEPFNNIKSIKTCFPGKPVIVYTSQERSIWEIAVCRSGVQAFVTKTEDPRYLKEVIRRVSNGEDLAKARLDEVQNDPSFLNQDLWKNQVKPWEMEIISLYHQKKSIKEIAQIKSRSEWAIRKTLQKLKRRFHVKTYEELIDILLRNH